MDAGAIVLQDWCFVKPGETARELWERALAPLGLKMLGQAVHDATVAGKLSLLPQVGRFATRAPALFKELF